MEVLASRANHLRRRHSALETLVLDGGAGGLRVRKRVPSWAPRAGRVDALLAARDRVAAAAGAAVRVPDVLGRGDDFVDLAFEPGEPALARVERALLSRRFDAAAATLREVGGVLDAFPVADADPAADPGFAERFGDADGAEPCVEPGLYDFGLDNLLLGGPDEPPVLVDFEWAFPFPVPLRLVRWVGVRHAAEYLQPLVRALASPRLPGLVLFDDVIIPERWLADAGVDPADCRRLLAWECAFQGWLHVQHRPLADHAVHPSPRRVEARADENAAQRIVRLERELAAAQEDAWAARRRLADLEGVKTSAAHVGRLVTARARRRLGR